MHNARLTQMKQKQKGLLASVLSQSSHYVLLERAPSFSDSDSESNRQSAARCNGFFLSFLLSSSSRFFPFFVSYPEIRESSRAVSAGSRSVLRLSELIIKASECVRARREWGGERGVRKLGGDRGWEI